MEQKETSQEGIMHGSGIVHNRRGRMLPDLGLSVSEDNTKEENNHKETPWRQHNLWARRITEHEAREGNGS
jgi:hypothetical protein